MPIKKKIEFFIQPSFLIKKLEKIDTALLKTYTMTFRKVDKEIFAGKFIDKEKKTLVNQVFIEKSILSEAKSINNNAESKNKE